MDKGGQNPTGQLHTTANQASAVSTVGVLASDPLGAEAPHMLVTESPPSVAVVKTFFDQTSGRSRRDRFHGSLSEMPITELNALTQPHTDRLNVFGIDQDSGEILGVASAELCTSFTAEVAIWVLDRCQHQGAGTTLATALVERLARAGVCQVFALIESSNSAAFALWAKVFPDSPLPNRPHLHAETWVSAQLSSSDGPDSERACACLRQ